MEGLILDPRTMIVERFEDVADWLYNRKPEGISANDIAMAIGWDPKVFFNSIKNPQNASPKIKEDLAQAVERITKFLGVHVNTILRHRRQLIAPPAETSTIDLNPSISLD